MDLQAATWVNTKGIGRFVLSRVGVLKKREK